MTWENPKVFTKSEQEIREALWPLGNVERMAPLEPDYPAAPLGSRGLTDDEYAELARATREPGALSGVRLWLTWSGEPGIAELNAQAVAEYAERLGFTVLDVQVGEME